jgi:hypothetical protein
VLRHYFQRAESPVRLAQAAEMRLAGGFPFTRLYKDDWRRSLGRPFHGS